jgi:hypothetical protein
MAGADRKNTIAWFCARYNLYELLQNSTSPAVKLFRSKILGHKYTLWMVGALCGLSLLVEAPKRRAELAMYVMPKALESAWVTARGRGWVHGGGRTGASLLCAAGMGMVMVSAFLTNSQAGYAGFECTADVGIRRALIRTTRSICLASFEGFCTSLLGLIKDHPWK